MMRYMYANQPGGLLASSESVLDVGQYGFNYRAPVGVNVSTNQLFEYSAILIMAAYNSTVVRIDKDNDGVFEETAFLDRGETYEARQVSAGATVSGSKPIQCHMITGDIGSGYEMRWCTLFPDRQWGSSYFTPASRGSSVISSIFMFNPNTQSIAVRCETRTSTTLVTVAANSVNTFNPVANSGTHLYETNGMVFLPYFAMDVGGPASGNQIYEWGYGVISEKTLTTQILAPWAPGGASPTVNVNPIWVTALSNTTLYVDLDGNPATGPLVDPSGHRYNFSTNITRLQSIKIFDTSDNDQTGMRVYTLDDTQITGVWGQDPNLGESGNALQLDMGSSVLPFPNILPVKEGILYIDADTNGVVSPGDSIKFIIYVENIGFADANSVIVHDGGASNTTYITSSTFLNGTNLLDDVVPPALTLFPLDEQGYNIGGLAVGATAVVEYVVQIHDPFPTNVDGIVNGVFVDRENQVFIPVPQYGFELFKTSTPTNPVNPGDIISYTITVNSTGTVSQSGIRVVDPLPANTWWVTNSTRVIVPGPFKGSFRDEFDIDDEYNGRNGSLYWLSDWQESGEADGPGNGDIVVTSDSGAPGSVYMLRIQGGNKGAYRQANTRQYTNIVLSFDYRRDSLDSTSEWVAVQASTNGGGNWTQVARFAGAATDGAYIFTNYNITSFRATNMAVRFLSSSAMNNADRMWVDNVELTVWGRGVTNVGGAPSLLVEEYEMGTNESLIVQMDVGVSSSINISQVVNQVSITSFQSPAPLSTAVTNPVILPPRADISGYVRNDSDADGDLTDPDSGIAGVTIQLFSDPNGDGDPSDGLVLQAATTDAGGHYVFSNYLGNNYVVLETDLPNYRSTADRDGGNPNLIVVALSTAGVHSVSNNFLDTQLADVSGYVLNDTDGDGDFADADLGMAGVLVQIFTDPNGDGDPADGALVSAEVTDADGYFLFENVGTGRFVIVETDPEGFFSTADSEGANDNRIALFMAGGVHSVDNLFLDAASGIVITKSASPDSLWFPDLRVTYTVSVVNTGAVRHTGVVITDPLPTGISYENNSTRAVVTRSTSNDVLDMFSSVAYTNSDGSLPWLGPWVETDAGGGGATGGAIRVNNDALELSDAVTGVPEIRRGANLSGCTSAVFRFDYSTSVDVDSSDAVNLFVSTNGTTWISLGNLTGRVNGTASYNITPRISTSTYVRFVLNGYAGFNEYMWVDNAQISVQRSPTVTVVGGAPPNLLSGYDLDIGGSIVVTFTGIVGAVNGVTNRACVRTDVDPDDVCATITNSAVPSAGPSRIGGRVWEDIDSSGAPSGPDIGLAGVTVRLWSDPNGDGNPADGSVLDTAATDNLGFFLFANLSTGRYVLVETDPPAYESSGDSQGANDNRVAVFLNIGDSLTNYFMDRTISGLRITKTASEAGELDIGQYLAYSIIVSNTRASSQTGVTVFDSLPSALDYVSNSVRIVGQFTGSSNNFLDTFGQVTYTNNHGSLKWLTAWTEDTESDGPSLGDMYITSILGDNRLVIRDDIMSLQRSAALTGYVSAVLSLSYYRDGLEAGEYAMLEISTNGSTWTELDRYANDGSSSTIDSSFRATNYNITAWRSANTRIRFRTPAGGMSNGDLVYFDDVQIVVSTPGGTYTNAGSAPPVMFTGYTSYPNSTIVITYTTVVSDIDTIVNNACVTTASDSNGLCSSVSRDVSMVLLTQGVTIAAGSTAGVHLAWTASTEGQVVVKDYDLIYVDNLTPGFNPQLTNNWAWATTVTNSHYLDMGSGFRVPPTQIGNNMRFYRVARKDTWKPEKKPRFASKEVYVAKCLNLQEGENWVSLFAVPDSNTLARVFGTNALPGGTQISDSTRIEWYGPTQAGNATNVVWLSSSGHWLSSTGGIVNHMRLPLHEGFNLILPPGASNRKVVLVGRVPTNASAQAGHQLQVKGSGIYNVVSINLPYRMKVGQSGLRQAGFKGADPGKAVNPNNSDELRILQRGPGSLGSPRVRILMDGNGQFVYWSGGSGSAENYEMDVDDAIIVYTRTSSNDLMWNLTLPYDPPNININL
jgi:uncharacterized repeat protein (TIGR01451 family)